MLRVEHVEVMNFEAAVRGMRNPMNSWEKSDSGYGCGYDENDRVLEWCKDCDSAIECDQRYSLGDNDLALMKKLVKAGTDHRKFLRQIVVSMDITAPLFWWKEFDTYKVGTTANSCSTMHTITNKEFTIDDFSHDKMLATTEYSLRDIVLHLNGLREIYLHEDDSNIKKKYWYSIIQLLPSSYNQLRTVTMSYENLRNIYEQRKNHKLDEWRGFCSVIEFLPYSNWITDKKEGESND